MGRALPNYPLNPTMDTRSMLTPRSTPRSSHKRILPAAMLVLLGALLALTAGLALAGPPGNSSSQASPIHPAIPLLDSEGRNVLDSGQAVSSMQTCGNCHDTAFIARHNSHADLDLQAFSGLGETDLELNCFLCHTPEPDNAARIQALQSGRFDWANTATLLASGIVRQVGEGYRYDPAAFSADGTLAAGVLPIQDPANANCGACHGLVHTDLAEPLVKAGCDPDAWPAETAGEIISPQRMSDSGMNLAGKAGLSRSWDAHAERGLQCTACHYALNNPVYSQMPAGNSPEHLQFDPRRLQIGEYLYQPLHQFARGKSDRAGVAPLPGDASQGCAGCHDTQAGHTWLPYQEVHFTALSCETCHIPAIYSSAFQQVDRTVVRPQAGLQVACRGVEGENGSLNALVSGYQPVWMPQPTADGGVQMAPFNLVSTWYWVYGDPPRPVQTADLQAAWLEGDSYPDEILATFDAGGDGLLVDSQLAIISPRQEALVAGRLAALGLENPRITAEVQPYRLNHSVAGGKWALRDCQDCHSQDSRLSQPLLLAEYTPGGVLPQFVPGDSPLADGDLYLDEAGALYYRPASAAGGRYVLGLHRSVLIDRLGFLLFAGVLLGVALHGGLRHLAARRRSPVRPRTQRVYMYTIYERLWHWLQTFVILGLVFTGLVIHRPDAFGILSFRYAVLVHNILAGILVVNAALALFYHLASGQIRQFLPRPAGFFDHALGQAVYYLRGIFKGERHPFEKTPQEKLNPLQKVTYFSILNLLLPLQVITGTLMWGAQRWPELTARFGGLPFLAPLHTLVAWLFAAFIVMHVYLTTTGHAPLAGIKAMMAGWDEVEVHVPAEEEPEL